MIPLNVIVSQNYNTVLHKLERLVQYPSPKPNTVAMISLLCSHYDFSYLCLASHPTIESSKRYNLFLVHDVLEITDCFPNIHMLNGLCCLTSILYVHNNTILCSLLYYLKMHSEIKPSRLACCIQIIIITIISSGTKFS